MTGLVKLLTKCKNLTRYVSLHTVLYPTTPVAPGTTLTTPGTGSVPICRNTAGVLKPAGS